MNLLTSPQLEWNLCSIRLSEIWDAKTKWASSCSRTHCSPTCSPSVCTISWTTVIRQKSVLLRQRSQQGESCEFTFALFVSEIFLWEMRVKAFKMWGRFVILVSALFSVLEFSESSSSCCYEKKVTQKPTLIWWYFLLLHAVDNDGLDSDTRRTFNCRYFVELFCTKLTLTFGPFSLNWSKISCGLWGSDSRICEKLAA